MALFYSCRITKDEPTWLGTGTTKQLPSLHLFLKQPIQLETQKCTPCSMAETHEPFRLDTPECNIQIERRQSPSWYFVELTGLWLHGVNNLMTYHQCGDRILQLFWRVCSITHIQLNMYFFLFFIIIQWKLKGMKARRMEFLSIIQMANCSHTASYTSKVNFGWRLQESKIWLKPPVMIFKSREGIAKNVHSYRKASAYQHQVKGVTVSNTPNPLFNQRLNLHKSNSPNLLNWPTK